MLGRIVMDVLEGKDTVYTQKFKWRTPVTKTTAPEEHLRHHDDKGPQIFDENSMALPEELIAGSKICSKL
jgi:hypothetical protein